LDETRRNIDLEKRKWINVPIGDSSCRHLEPSLELNIPVHYQQGDFETCLFRSFASALHYIGQKQTGSVLASMAKKNENLGGDKQLEEIIAAMKKHETVYKKMDYWKKKRSWSKRTSWAIHVHIQSCWYFVDMTVVLSMPWR
jgi:hypothetical protein